VPLLLGVVSLLLAAGVLFHRARVRALQRAHEHSAARALELERELAALAEVGAEATRREKTLLDDARSLEHELRTKGLELERHVEELQRAGRLKSEFMATMSHELRTPLNAVIGFTDVLLEGTYGPLNPRQRQCADDVIDAGRHLLALIDDILDVSKIEAGRMELSLHTIDLAEATAEAVKLVRPQSAAKLVQLEDLVTEGVFFVRADFERVRQVLVNLLSNAVKFTPKGGSVRVLGAVVGGFVRISVTDTGVGIAEHDRDKLFREFSQVDGSVTRKFGGTGLGLAISRRLVTMHGGRIDFTSRVGEGSTFWIDLPMPPRATPPTFSRGAVKRRRAQGEDPATKDAPTVLVLDEDPASQRIVESALAEAGLRVACAASLSEARELAHLPSLEILVLDPALAESSAEEVDQFVTARFGPRVVVSSLGSRAEVTRGLPEAMFVAKPIDGARLIERVRVARRLERSRKRVLAVDDNDQNLRLLTTVLGSRGYEVIEARSGASALDLARTAEPDVILMDVMLPDLDGLTVTRELKAHDSTKSIPIIAVTAQAMAGDAERARAAGCVEHIPKPIDRKLLLQAIERAVG